MNAPTDYDVTIYGLNRDEYHRVLEAVVRGGTIREGIDFHLDIHAPEPEEAPAPNQGSTPAVSPEAEASKAPDDTPAAWVPPIRTPGYLAALVTDLPRNSMVVVYAADHSLAAYAYHELVDQVPRDLIGRQVLSNGHKRTVLTNGTTIVPRPDHASRSVAAHLVIVAERPEAFTQRMAETVVPITAAPGGQIVLMGEGSADA